MGSEMCIRDRTYIIFLILAIWAIIELPRNNLIWDISHSWTILGLAVLGIVVTGAAINFSAGVWNGATHENLVVRMAMTAHMAAGDWPPEDPYAPGTERLYRYTAQAWGASLIRISGIGLFEAVLAITTTSTIALFVTIFLGGWSGPIFWPPLDEQIITEGVPIPNFEGDPILTVNTPGLPLFDEDPNEWVQQKRGEIEFTSGQLFFSGTIWFILKTVAVIFFVLLPRGVFPRIRIDMLLHIGWYKLIGLAFVNIFIALGLLYAGVLGPEGFL